MGLVFKNIAICAKKDHVKILDILQKIIQILDKHDCNIFLDDICKSLLQTDSPTMPQHGIDLILSLGGDGSLLHIARETLDFAAPILGINIGQLGFLADVSMQELDSLQDILQGEYCTEERQVLEMSVLRDNAVIAKLPAINEVVLFNGSIVRLIEFKVFVDDHFMMQQRSDGMIIATPTGSTAYALSAGGPILHPGLGDLLLVPVCAHSLSARPIVISDSSRINIHIPNNPRSLCKIGCDGQVHIDIHPCDIIQVVKSKYKLILLHPKTYNYYDMLRRKLGWYHEITKQT